MRNKNPRIRFVNGEAELSLLEEDNPLIWDGEAGIKDGGGWRVKISVAHRNKIILMSHQAWSPLYEAGSWKVSSGAGRKFPTPDGTGRQHGVRFAVRPARILIDEMHVIKNRDTGFWKMLGKVADSTWPRPTIVGLSATPIQASPLDLSAFVHTTAKNKAMRERLVDALKEWANMATALDKEELNAGPANKVLANQIEMKVKQCQVAADDFYRRIGIQMRGDDTFFGRSVTDYKSQPSPEPTCCEPPAKWSEYIVPLCESSGREAVDILEQMVAKAQQANQPPVALDRLFRKLIPQKGAGGRCFTRLEVVATIPVIAQVLSNKKAKASWFDHMAMEQKYFKKGLLNDPMRHSWYKIIRDTMGECPKLVELFRIV